MSEEENFLARWSRRKREAAEPEATPPPEREPEIGAVEPAPMGAEPHGTQTSPSQERAAAESGTEPQFDLSSLPPIDAIGPDTDIRGFLRPGVPADLTRAALRRAWSVTPGIRDYIGPSENSWDFTAAGPDGVPGFDFGDPGVDLRRLAGQLFGREKESAAESPPDSPPSAPAAEVLPATAENHDLLKVSPEAARVTTQDHVAVQHGPEESDGSHAMREDEEPAPVRRRHGGALPS